MSSGVRVTKSGKIRVDKIKMSSPLTSPLPLPLPCSISSTGQHFKPSFVRQRHQHPLSVHFFALDSRRWVEGGKWGKGGRGGRKGMEE